jgi:hypothetical protein
MLRTSLVSVFACAFALSLVPHAMPSAQKPRTHRLEAKPDTVAYGYYWSEATPALRIASGDIIDVDTLGVHVRMPKAIFKGK